MGLYFIAGRITQELEKQLGYGNINFYGFYGKVRPAALYIHNGLIGAAI